MAAQGPPYFLGIDLGTTSVKVSIIDNAGQLLSQTSEDTHVSYRVNLHLSLSDSTLAILLLF